MRGERSLCEVIGATGVAIRALGFRALDGHRPNERSQDLPTHSHEPVPPDDAVKLPRQNRSANVLETKVWMHTTLHWRPCLAPQHHLQARLTNQFSWLTPSHNTNIFTNIHCNPSLINRQAVCTRWIKSLCAHRYHNESIKKFFFFVP